MLGYIYQLVSNFVCVPFGAGQEAYSGFLEHFINSCQNIAVCGNNAGKKSSEKEPEQIKLWPVKMKQ